MTLRSRLALLLSVTALAASVLVGLFTYQTTGAELGDSIDDFLVQRASEVEDGLRNSPGNGRRQQRPVDEGNLRDAADDDSIIQVTGRNGLVVSTGAQLPDPSSDRGFEDVSIDGETFRMYSTELTDGREVQVARSTEESEEVLESLVSRFALIAVAVAAGAAAIGWLIASYATRPLRRLAAVANDVAQTRDFSATGDLSDAERADEIGSLATSFRSMLDALQASRTQQHRLIHDAGHELRTPLTSMRANVELLERAGDLPLDQRREVVTAIKSELLELNDLFDEMIDLATDEDHSDIAFVPIDLGAIAESVAHRWHNRSGRPIDVQRGDTTNLVMGDAPMLERAISNLISNAVKFSPDGSAIGVSVSDGAVGVSDAGPGVPLQDRAYIFDRFHRSDETRSMPGSGLGLSIVAQIVERHGGTTWVGEAAAGGAEVGFRLQALDDATAASASSAGVSRSDGLIG